MYKIKPLSKVKKTIIVPPDKSISHRAAIISSLSSGKTVISPFILSEDTSATLDCLKNCGVKAKLNQKTQALLIEGCGLRLPVKQKVNLQAKESGTTLRIFSGVLCGQRFSSCFNGWPALSIRPMSRITKPLRMMGADIEGKKIKGREYTPLVINPAKKLTGINYELPVASAQVKSAVLFLTLYSSSKTQIYEPFACRDHTERMLGMFGAKIERKNNIITAYPVKSLASPGKIFIPSDFSAAAFFIVLGLILKNSRILIKNVNLNPTRCGLLNVLKRMGADIEILNEKRYFEPYGDIIVKSSSLKGVEVKKEEIPLMVDEVPALCVAAAFAKGKTVIRGVKELKVKETDRIKSIVYNLGKMGVKVQALKYPAVREDDWMIKIEPAEEFKPAKFKSFSDHRTAMSAIIAAAASGKECFIDDIECINKSFPRFKALFEAL